MEGRTRNVQGLQRDIEVSSEKSLFGAMGIKEGRNNNHLCSLDARRAETV